MSTKDVVILYVDDDANNLTAFKAAFRREYRVLVAQSGVEALEVLQDQSIHIVIADQRMPEMTGAEFLEKVRREFPKPIRIILTGFSDIGSVIHAINEGGVFRYITKPWQKEELRMTIEIAHQVYELKENNQKLITDLQVNLEELQKTLKRFSQFVPKSVVEEALQLGEDFILRGERKQAAVLFCDLRNFTPLSEQFSPEEVVNFLNDFYSVMTEAVVKHEGSIIQFIGDEIYAAFGTPVSHPNNEENAVFCALEMREKSKQLSKKYFGKFHQEIFVGIGINSGEVIAGNMGSQARVNYSVIGDTVNTAKRIEMLTKSLPNAILIHHTVFEKVEHLIKVQRWEPVFLKGKEQQIQVYEVLDRC
jgi:class 3 adenylate cyclase